MKEFADALGLGRNGDAIVRQWEAGELVPNNDQYEKIMNFASAVPFPNQGDKFTFIDLFAGIGGIRIPFGEYGGKCVFSSEWDKHAQQTYRINFGETPSGNIQEIMTSDIPDFDVLLGGFPCQPFRRRGFIKVSPILEEHCSSR